MKKTSWPYRSSGLLPAEYLKRFEDWNERDRCARSLEDQIAQLRSQPPPREPVFGSSSYEDDIERVLHADSLPSSLNYQIRRRDRLTVPPPFKTWGELEAALRATGQWTTEPTAA